MPAPSSHGQTLTIVLPTPTVADLTRTDPNALDIDSLHVVLTTKQRILLYIVAGFYSAAFFVCGVGYVPVLNLNHNQYGQLIS